MNDKISKLYLEMLLELRKRLDKANAIFVHMSELLIAGMTEERFPARSRKELLTLDAEYRAILAGVMKDVEKLYPGRIELFPVKPDCDFLAGMEKRNDQMEELERIINEMLSACGHEDGILQKQENNQWRLIMENVDFKEEFNRKFKAEPNCNKRPNILVAGYTGCGKTSLIRTVLGDVVPAEAVKNDRPQQLDFDKYENESITLWDSRGLELGDTEEAFCDRMKAFVAERQDDHNVDEHIHLVWYLIQGSCARVTESDLKLLKNIFTFDDVIVAVSKKDITSDKQLKAIRQVLIEAEVPEERIVAVSDAESGALGCQELVSLSLQMLPAAYKDAFIAAQSIDREAKAKAVQDKVERAREIINTAIKQAEEVAASPIPVTDGGLLIPVEIEQVAALLALYGLREKSVRDEAAGFVDAMVKAFTGALSELDFDPEAGISAEVAAVLTGALGHYVQNNFEAYALAKVKGTPLPALGFDLELFKEFYQTYNHGLKMKPNILVCGKTGVGKTSLIQAVTHRGVVPDSAIGNGKATTEGFQLYETEIANFIDSEGMNPGSQSVDDYADFILDEVLDRLDSDDKENLIHNIWYCIDGSGARVQESDAKLIKTFSDKVILVVTKSELMRKEQSEAMMRTLLDLIDKDRIVMVSAERGTGLKQLIAKSQSMSENAMNGADDELEAFRDRWNDYYANMKQSWQAEVEEEADSFINWAAGRAAAIALIPLPLADVMPLIANETYMIYRLAGVYGKAIDETVITTLLGVAGGSLVGKIGASFLPFLKVPIAAGVTYGVGKAAKVYFESEMTLSASELKAAFLAGEREARKRDWKPVDED